MRKYSLVLGIAGGLVGLASLANAYDNVTQTYSPGKLWAQSVKGGLSAAHWWCVVFAGTCNSSRLIQSSFEVWIGW